MNTQAFLNWLKAKHPRPVLTMGILNVTTDSFSDGGLYRELHPALEHAHTMIAQGADIIDIGGESYRPGASPVSVDEELARIIPVIEGIRDNADICISVDTYKPDVMREAIKAGASWINDITALQTPGALETVAALKTPICLMHMQGKPNTMQHAPQYTNVIDEINAFFAQRIQACLDAGIAREALILDPGFGFGKAVQHNLLLTKQISRFCEYELPILLGTSRKQTIGYLLNQDTLGRLAGGLALTVYAAMHGVSIIRTHDVLETKQALTILEHIQAAE